MERVFTTHADSNNSPYRSTLELFEGDNALTLPHAAHADIQDKGSGRFSHWGNYVYFSSSDNTSPLDNGKSYQAKTPLFLNHKLYAALLILLLALLFVGERKVFLNNISHLAIFSLYLAGFLVFSDNSALSFMIPPGSEYLFLRCDTNLASSIILHLFVGVALFLFVCSWSLFFMGGLRDECTVESVDRLVFQGYPFGLLAVFFISIAALLLHIGHGVALLLTLTFFSFFAVTYRRALGYLLRQSVIPLLIACVVCFFFSLYYHGPTESLSATTHGDLHWYAGESRLMEDNFFRNANIGVLGDKTIFLYNRLPMALSAAIARIIPAHDHYLFFTSSGIVYFILFASMFFRLLRKKQSHLRRSYTALRTLTLMALLSYPSWIAASAPIPYAFPILVSLFLWFDCFGRNPSILRLIGYLGMTIVMSLFTKVAGFFPLATLASSAYFRKIARWKLSVRMLLVGIAACGLIYLATTDVLLIRHALNHFTLGPESLQGARGMGTWRYIALILCDIGKGLLVLCFLSKKNSPYLLLLLVSLALVWCVPGLFYWSFGTMVVLTLLLVETGKLTPRSTRVYLFSLVLISAGCVFSRHDTYLLGMILFWAFTSLSLPTNGNQLMQIPFPQHVITTLVPCVLLLCIAISTVFGVVRFRHVQHHPQNIISPDFFDVWKKVSSAVPENALLFTPTGDDSWHTSGWNTVSYFGCRQIYASALEVSSLRLENHKREREDKLANNSAVLEGKKHPSKIAFVAEKGYTEFYAVLPKDQAAGNKWLSLAYNNETYGIYRIIDP